MSITRAHPNDADANARETQSPLFQLRNVTKWFPIKTGVLAGASAGQASTNFVHAVDGVNLTLKRGEVLGVAGSSGSGKTSLAFTMLRLYEPTSGEIRFKGEDITHLSGRELKPLRRQAQIIFQDPYGSLNPRFTVARTIYEPLIVHKIGSKSERVARAHHALELAELTPPALYMDRYPHQLSGGQRQRVSIARAMVLDAEFLIADEPVSMLDVSIRAGILTLLNSLVSNLGLSVLLVSHDIASMRYVCHMIAIMHKGKIVEKSDTEQVVNRPLHPYTQALISAVPEMTVGLQRPRVNIKADIGASSEIPRGCRFRDQCPHAMAICAEQEPELAEVEPGHEVACHLYAH